MNSRLITARKGYRKKKNIFADAGPIDVSPVSGVSVTSDLGDSISGPEIDQFQLGQDMANVTNSANNFLNNMKMPSNLLGKAKDLLKGGAGEIGSVIGGAAGSALSGGLSSSAGNTISKVGAGVASLVGKVNPLIGGVMGAASGVIGGLANRAFGMKTNQERLNEINTGINTNKNFVSNASSFDDIKGPAATMTNTNVYTGGWFSSGKARRKNQALRNKMLDAKSWADRSIGNNVSNLADDQMNDALANFAAYGGFIFPSYDFGRHLFAEGGVTNPLMEDPSSTPAITNEYSDDIGLLASQKWQPMATQLKQDEAKYNIDDYAYRVQKFHPDITKEQVQQAYNKVPVIGSDRTDDSTVGAYTSGDNERIMLYPNIWEKTGKRPNAETVAPSFSHETNHNFYTNLLEQKSTDEEKDLLWGAYRPGFVFSGPDDWNKKVSEMRATNAEIRRKISQQHNNAVGKDLDDAIDNLPNDKLMDIYYNTNAYIQKGSEKHMQKNGQWDPERMKILRTTLKDVAYNPSANPIPENMAAEGGGIDIDPSSAIGYALYTDKFIRDKQKDDSGMTNLFAGIPNTMFAKGGNLLYQQKAPENKPAYSGILEKKKGGYKVGQTIDVSEQEAKKLKSLGYEFTILE